jgi:predicted DNA-binding protein (MmcQ/YjbR family)
MTGAHLRRLCLALPGAREEFPFRPGLSVFKVGARMFALSALNEMPLRISLKCDLDLGAQLRHTYPAITPGYHLNKRHWLTLTDDGSIPDQLITDLIQASYDLVAPTRPARSKKRRRRAARLSNKRVAATVGDRTPLQGR